ncbi:MAG: HAD-IIIA family hydrolase [Chloroflexota bacterium]|nr:HAD-IIIA family hydrolase [Chloroflexota bacterium]
MGETLVDETRVWQLWADAYEIPRLTMFAVIGATIVQGGQHRTVFDRLGMTDWLERGVDVEAAYGGFRDEDLYPDARRAVPALVEAGYRVAIVANQPATRTAELRALGIEAEVMAMSDELGAYKPQPEFFARSLELMGNPDPSDVVYVGDRVDNDVVASTAAGMRAVWIRRGPWGYLQVDHDRVAHAEIDSLDELVGCLPGVFEATS